MHNIDWTTVIIQILLVIVTAVAAIIAFVVYSRQKRDDTAAKARNYFVSFANNCDTLNELINYDVVHEIVSCVVYSDLIVRNMSQVCYFIENGADLREFKWPWPITVPIHSKLIDDYEVLIRRNQEICAAISVQFPSLFRIYQSIFTMFHSILSYTKNFARDERVFGIIFLTALKRETHPSQLQDEIFYNLSLRIVEGLMNQQKNINDALLLLDLVNKTFLKLSPSQLSAQSKREFKMHLKEYQNTQTIFEDFQEAEKALEKIMNQRDILKFRELYTKIKVRQEDQRNDEQ